MLRKQILAWLSILVFFTSTTGMPIFKHICHSSNTKMASITELVCEEVDVIDTCCQGAEEHHDCCDTDVSFEKYTPNGKIEKESVIKVQICACDICSPQFVEIEFLIYQGVTVDDQSLAPPSPDISDPLTVQERLSLVQSYLC